MDRKGVNDIAGVDTATKKCSPRAKQNDAFSTGTTPIEKILK
jgi:hypothetical protein